MEHKATRVARVLRQPVEAFYEHGRMDHNSTLYSEMLHVPFVLRLPPGVDASAVDTGQLVTLADIVPTLLSAAGLKLPQAYLGWTMVTLASAFWHDQVAAVPYDRRLLLLPHCLRNEQACPADAIVFGLGGFVMLLVWGRRVGWFLRLLYPVVPLLVVVAWDAWTATAIGGEGSSRFAPGLFWDPARLRLLLGGATRLLFTTGSMGTAIVTGMGSQWNNSDVLYVGRSGTGELTIAAGGVVTNTDGFLGEDTDSMGTATVTGDDSTWTNSESLYVGGSSTSAGGTGVLTIDDGGTVKVADTLQVWDGGTVAVNGQITGADNASVTLTATGAGTTLTANVVTAGNAITVTNGLTLGTNVELDTTKVGGSATGGAITVGSTNQGPPKIDCAPVSPRKHRARLTTIASANVSARKKVQQRQTNQKVNGTPSHPVTRRRPDAGDTRALQNRCKINAVPCRPPQITKFHPAPCHKPPSSMVNIKLR